MKFFGFCVASVHGLALNSTVIEDVGAMANSQVLVMSKNPPFSISWPFGATEPIIATYENFNYNGFYVKQVCSATLNGRTYLFGGGTSIEDPQRQQVARVRGDMTGLDILSAQLPYPMVEHSCSTVRNKWIMLCGTADTVSGEFRYETNEFLLVYFQPPMQRFRRGRQQLPVEKGARHEWSACQKRDGLLF